MLHREPFSIKVWQPIVKYVKINVTIQSQDSKIQ